MQPAAFVLLGVLSLAVAAYAVVVYAFLPFGATVHPEVAKVFGDHRAAVYTHAFAAALALAIGPFQFWTRLRTGRPALHRWLGRVYLGAGVVLGGVSGLVLALHAFGGPVSRAGFACLALAWLYTGARAFLAIRAGAVARHRAWMVRNFSLAFAAVTLRLYLPGAVVAGIPFETAYAVIAWLCWLPNLLVAEWLLNRKNPCSSSAPTANAATETSRPMPRTR